MNKAVLSNRIYMSASEKMQETLDKELTYAIPSYNPTDPPLIIKNMARVRKDLVSIPMGRTDLIPEDYEIIDKRISVPAEFPEFKFELRESQQKVHDELDDSCIINAWVSWGKTFTGLAIAAKLKQKTLIVTHTIALRNQWAKEAEKVFGIEPSIIGSGKMELEGPIVIGNTQTLYKNIEKIRKEFGLVILDECLDYGSRVNTREGYKTIGSLVNSKTYCDVLSFNESTKIFEWKPILRHFKNSQEDLMIKFHFSNQSVLKCTMNHTIHTLNKGKIKAEYLMEEDYVIAQKSFKGSHLLTEASKPLILGMILGDGHLQSTKSSVRLAVTHGEAQVDYLDYKIDLLKDMFSSDTCISRSGYKKSNMIASNVSLCFHDIDNWKEQLYGGTSGNKTILPKEISDKLTRDSWAIMYQDDGTIGGHKKDVVFSFCELDTDSISNLQESLLNLFGISSKQYQCKKGFNYLSLNRESSKIFIEDIEDLIHPCLDYKKGVYKTGKVFLGSSRVTAFETYTVQKVVDVTFEKAARNYRYNIEVADNHNYLVSDKLVGNCHHVSSPTFSKVIDTNYCRYKIGLSGTIERKDGKHVVFRDYFGHKIFQPPKENYMVPKITAVNSDIRFQDGAGTPWATRVSNLCSDPNYLHLIAMLASAYAAKGHNVLVVCDRVYFLKSVAELVGENAICITGSVPPDERDLLVAQIGKGKINVLCGTQAIFSEGISVDPLSCLILGTPVNNEPLLTQLIGRVVRELEGKQQPVVVDIHLKGNTARRQASSRMGYYMKQGYEVGYL